MDEPAPVPARTIGGAIGKAALLAGGLLGAAALLRAFSLGEQQEFISDAVINQGARGLVVFLLAASLCCAFGIPRQAIAFAAGSIAGPDIGTLLALPAEVVGAALNLLWAGTIARDWARRHLPRRAAKMSAFLKAYPFSATLTLRLLPIGNNMALNILAGMLGIKAAPYLAASAIGYLPQTIVFAFLGSGARVADGTQLWIGFGLLVLSTVVGLVLLRRYRALV
jgi:uncharacterized membrane protein YdjX (TVP38/TMEM64 family)